MLRERRLLDSFFFFYSSVSFSFFSFFYTVSLQTFFYSVLCSSIRASRGATQRKLSCLATLARKTVEIRFYSLPHDSSKCRTKTAIIAQAAAATKNDRVFGKFERFQLGPPFLFRTNKARFAAAEH